MSNHPYLRALMTMVALIVGFGPVSTPVGAAVSLQVIARRGDPAPGGEGYVFVGFGRSTSASRAIALHDDGTIAFLAAALESPSNPGFPVAYSGAVFRKRPASALELGAGQSFSATLPPPGPPRCIQPGLGVEFWDGDFTAVGLLAGGAYTISAPRWTPFSPFRAGLAKITDVCDGVILHDASTLAEGYTVGMASDSGYAVYMSGDGLYRISSANDVQSVARSGTLAPGGGTFTGTNVQFYMNQRGDIVFLETISIASGPGAPGGYGVYFVPVATGAPELVALSGVTPAPPDVGGVVFLAGGSQGIAIADSGFVAFVAVTKVFGQFPGGSLETLASTTDLPGQYAPRFVDSRGDMIARDNGLVFIPHGGTPLTVIAVGDLVPGSTDTFFSDFTTPILNNNGAALVRADFRRADLASAGSGLLLVSGLFCGNGTVDAGEDCDDGTANGTPNSCCSATCQFRPVGMACVDDGDLCTEDTCNGAGTCTHYPAPSPVCATAAVGGAALRMRARLNANQLAFKWAKGPAVPLSDFGTPPSEPTRLCVYDQTGSDSYLLAMRGSPSALVDGVWTATSASWKFKSETGSPEGISRVTLKAATVPLKARVQVNARGNPAFALPLQKNPRVVVQFKTSLGRCWGASFATSILNTATEFKAKSD